MPLVKTYGGRVHRLPSGLIKTGCCCGPSCCDDVGGSPTAIISYEQLTTSPCTIRLSDDSVAGTCGTLSGRQWYLNGVPFSTSATPSLGVVTGDIITLEVTDTYGCIAEKSIEVVCGANLCCTGEFMPAFATLTLPTMPDTTGCECPLVSGQTFILPRFSACSYRLYLDVCTGEGDTYGIEILASVAPEQVDVGVTFDPTFGVSMNWQIPFHPGTPTSCRGTFNVPFLNNPISAEPCGTNAWSTGEAGKDAILVV